MTRVDSIQSEYRYHVEYLAKDRRVLRDLRLQSADFAHAIRYTRFDAFRRGLVDAYQPLAAGTRVEPLFPAGGSSSPRTNGFRVTIPLAGGQEHTCRFNISYFRSSADRVRAELLRTQEINGEAGLYYRLSAFLDEEEPPRPPNKLAISLEPVADPMAVGSGCLRDYGPTEAWDAPSAADLPVLVDRGVVEEIVAEARSDAAREIAGFLLGHLKRDVQTNEAFVVVTGLASAGGTTQSSGTSVTFTPASFIQGRAIAKLRDAGETVLGWYHSHPFMLCPDCPTPAHPTCIDKVLSYSLDDMHLMESTFDQPFMVGLLTAVEPRIEKAIGHLPVKLYGSRNGEIQARRFRDRWGVTSLKFR